MTVVNRFIESGFRWYSKVVYRNQIAFFIGPMLLTLILASGWLKFRFESDLITLFSPTGSEWDSDRKVFEAFFGLNETSMKYALVSAKNDQNSEMLLDRNVAAELSSALEYMEKIMSINYEGTDYNYFPDLYLADSPYNLPNEIVTIFLNDYKDEPTTAMKSQLRYPVTKMFGHQLYLPFAFGGVTLEPNSSRIASVRSILMRYSVMANNDSAKFLAAEFEKKLEKYSESLSPDSALDVAIYSWDSLVNEVRKNTYYTLKYVPGAAFLVLVFTIIASSNLDMETSCHFHAVAGLFSVVMSYISGLGVVLYCGLPYNDLVSLTSFLALAIGVDDTFILLGAWKRHGSPKSKMEDRLEETLAEAGSSITFTSITSIMAFGVGASMKVPALRDFCIFTATAIFFDFAYQITFFPAAMIFAEKLRPFSMIVVNKFWRSNSITSSTLEKVAPLSSPKVAPLQKPAPSIFALKIPMAVVLPKKRKKKSRAPFPEEFYKLIKSKTAQGICLLLLLLLAAFSLYGTAIMKPSSSFSKLIVDDSKTHAYVTHYDKYFWSEALLYHAIVKSPDFRNASDVFYFMDFVNKLESMGNYSVGSDSTTLWMTAFFDYLQLFNLGYDQLAIGVDEYLRKSPNPDVKTHRKLTELGQTVYIPSEFYFSTGFWGIDNWAERAQFLKNLSKLKSEFPKFQPSFFSEPIFLTDLLIYSEAGLSSTVGIALLCIFGITMLFLPWEEPILVFWVSTSFLTINGSVIGMLSWWSVDIDIVSMVTLVMSVGFSVDYTVHFAYQFSHSLHERRVTNYENSSSNRSFNSSGYCTAKKDFSFAILESFRAVLKPIAMSGTSTLVAVFLMIFVHSYMIRVFVKTVFLVVILGLLQSLVVLPMVFLLTARLVPARETFVIRIGCKN